MAPISLLLFPAYAGVILSRDGTGYRLLPFPRLRGGDPYLSDPTENAILFSPPTRG